MQSHFLTKKFFPDNLLYSACLFTCIFLTCYTSEIMISQDNPHIFVSSFIQEHVFYSLELLSYLSHFCWVTYHSWLCGIVLLENHIWISEPSRSSSLNIIIVLFKMLHKLTIWYFYSGLLTLSRAVFEHSLDSLSYTVTWRSTHPQHEQQ